MAIIGTLPNNITNGQAVDANPLMADFNFIVNQVNANGAPLGTLTAPAGTSVAFQQATAPLGWIAQTGTAYTDAFLRCISPALFGGTSGVNSASMLIVGPITGDGHALTIGELAAHTHTDSGHTHTDAGHTHRPGDLHNFYTDGTSATITGPGALNLSTASGTNVGIANIQNGFASIQNTGSGTAHSHTLTANCKFVDQIVAVKS